MKQTNKKVTPKTQKITKPTKKRQSGRNPKIIKPPKRSHWIMEYLDVTKGEIVLINEAFIARLSTEFVAWAKDNDDVLYPRLFFAERGIADRTFYEWLEVFPHLQDAYSVVKTLVAARREIGGLTRELDGSLVARAQPNYCSEWRATMKYQSDLRKQENRENQTGIRVVEIPVFKQCDEVKPAPEPQKPQKTPEEVAKAARKLISNHPRK